MDLCCIGSSAIDVMFKLNGNQKREVRIGLDAFDTARSLQYVSLTSRLPSLFGHTVLSFLSRTTLNLTWLKSAKGFELFGSSRRRDKFAI
jgi:hypothetical protein